MSHRNIVVSRKSAERSATVPIPAPVVVPRKRKGKAKAVLTPGTYASPRAPGMALPRTFSYGNEPWSPPTAVIRSGGEDFLKYESKGVKC